MAWTRGLKIALLMARSDGFLRSSGWAKSILRQRAATAGGEPIPWMTYSAISFLTDRVEATHRVFEYGSGFSTLWWRDRVAHVDTVEHDAAWLDSLHLAPGAMLREDKQQYVDAIGVGPYDIVVVDGEWRNECAQRALTALSDGGVIVWDNSEIDHYASGLQVLLAAGFRRVDFTGPAPMNHYAHTTTVLYRDGNCLGI